MRRGMNHTLMSGAALALVIAALVFFDPRVRGSFSELVSDTPSVQFAQVGTGLYELGTVMVTVAREHSIANAPLTVFVVIATVLMLFMVRT